MQILHSFIFAFIVSGYQPGNTVTLEKPSHSGIIHAMTDSTADKIILTQRTSGGWPKHIDNKAFDYDSVWSKDFVKRVEASTSHPDATIDNHATTREIRALLKVHHQTGNKKYLSAAESGIDYLLKMQYASGGFPQFYPDTSGYRKHITYNDNAMLNALRVLKDVAEGRPGFESVDENLKKRSAAAVEKAIDCILKTQIRVNGKRTVWCAQHDPISFLPAQARAYELPSFSGAESVDITRFLMEIKNPSKDIKNAIIGSVEWLSKAAIMGYKTERIIDASQPKGKDVVVIEDPNGKMWARFYDLDSGKPFFCGRDGIKKSKLSEIENERRVGYAYYGVWPEKLISRDFPIWLSQNQ
ncbi:pectate lyase [Dyadobacter sp. 32]|uniref:pectate lyase n=1 Tax=Dyadobacter sp. 32 TaxID=538966 RepID=UPI0011F030CD